MRFRKRYWLWIALLAVAIASTLPRLKNPNEVVCETDELYWAELKDGNVLLTQSSDAGGSRMVTIPVSAGTSVESCEVRDGWAVARLHANPSASYFAAWNLTTNDTCASPGYIWMATPEHFVSVHRVHFGQPEDPSNNLFFYVDGEELPIVETFPDGVDGTRGRFAMRLGRSDHGQVFRLSFPQEDMYDSSVLLWQRPDGEWQLLGHHKKDSGSRLTINYGWDIESTYTIEWTDGTPVVHVSLESTDSKRGPMPEAKMTTETKTREGVLTPDGVIWDTPIE